MEGTFDSEMMIAVLKASGLGGLPCALMFPEKARTELGIIRQHTSLPININFFCHKQQTDESACEAAWKCRLEPLYVELGLDPTRPAPGSANEEFCEIVEELCTEVVSFLLVFPT